MVRSDLCDHSVSMWSSERRKDERLEVVRKRLKEIPLWGLWPIPNTRVVIPGVLKFPGGNKGCKRSDKDVCEALATFKLVSSPPVLDDHVVDGILYIERGSRRRAMEQLCGRPENRVSVQSRLPVQSAVERKRKWRLKKSEEERERIREKDREHKKTTYDREKRKRRYVAAKMKRGGMDIEV